MRGVWEDCVTAPVAMWVVAVTSVFQVGVFAADIGEMNGAVIPWLPISVAQARAREHARGGSMHTFSQVCLAVAGFTATVWFDVLRGHGTASERLAARDAVRLCVLAIVQVRPRAHAPTRQYPLAPTRQYPLAPTRTHTPVHTRTHTHPTRTHTHPLAPTRTPLAPTRTPLAPTRTHTPVHTRTHTHPTRTHTHRTRTHPHAPTPAHAPKPKHAPARRRVPTPTPTPTPQSAFYVYYASDIQPHEAPGCGVYHPNGAFYSYDMLCAIGAMEVRGRAGAGAPATRRVQHITLILTRASLPEFYDKLR